MKAAPRSLKLLRESTGFLDDLQASPRMRDYAHLMRSLVDPRSLEDRIRDVVSQASADLFGMSYNEAKAVATVRRRLGLALHLFPLVQVPDAQTVRRHVREIEEERRENRGVFPRESLRTSHSSTIAST
jgi:hypothetical protein